MFFAVVKFEPISFYSTYFIPLALLTIILLLLLIFFVVHCRRNSQNMFLNILLSLSLTKTGNQRQCAFFGVLLSSPPLPPTQRVSQKALLRSYRLFFGGGDELLVLSLFLCYVCVHPLLQVCVRMRIFIFGIFREKTRHCFVTKPNIRCRFLVCKTHIKLCTCGEADRSRHDRCCSSYCCCWGRPFWCVFKRGVFSSQEVCFHFKTHLFFVTWKRHTVHQRALSTNQTPQVTGQNLFLFPPTSLSGGKMEQVCQGSLLLLLLSFPFFGFGQKCSQIISSPLTKVFVFHHHRRKGKPSRWRRKKKK